MNANMARRSVSCFLVLYACDSGTTDLREQLRRCHSESQAKVKEGPESSVSTPAEKAVSTAIRKCPPVKYSQITELVAD